MKCKKCGKKAVLYMRQHKLALCREDFLDWIPSQTQRFIHEYRMFDPDDRILVAVSGGKDSLALWDVLNRLGYRADGLHIGLGIDGGTRYSLKSRRFCEDFARDRGYQLTVVEVDGLKGVTIPEGSNFSTRGREKPCSLCGLTKRYIMNRSALEGGYTILATGHNLDDEAAALFGNTINWQTGYLVRQGPVLPARDGFVKKIKPFCRFYERETASYAFLRGIGYIYDECPYASGAKSIYYKELLNQLEFDRPGAKLSFYLSFLRAKKDKLFNPHPGNDTALQPCERCAQPTTAPGRCAYCRTWEQIQQRQVEREA